MKDFKPETQNNLTAEERDLIMTLLKYPALEKVFDPNRPQTVAETKKRLQISLADLERVVRSGSKNDAEKAAQIIRAYQTTLSFLTELEENRKKQMR